MTDPLELLDQYYDGTLSEEGARELRDYIKQNPENAKQIVLAAFVHTNLGDLLHGQNSLHAPALAPADSLFAALQRHGTPPAARKPFWFSRPFRYAAVAAAFFIAALATFPLWHPEPSTPPIPRNLDHLPTPLITAAMNPVWQNTPGTPPSPDGFPTGPLKLRSGLLLITLPSLSTLLISGPAEFSIDTSSQIHLYRGALASVVSPKGTGLTVLTPACSVTDLGTEFGVYVDRNQLTHAEVFKGKVRVDASDPAHSSRILLANHALQCIGPAAPLEDAPLEPLAFVTPSQFDHFQHATAEKNFARWSDFSLLLSADPKTLAYYTFQKPPLLSNTLPNLAAATHPNFFGLLDGPSWDIGRFPGKDALRFPGGKAAVHLNIPQPLTAFTITAWVNPENFALTYQQPQGNRFTALLLSDGVREGALHWQIMDGRRIELGLSLPRTVPSSVSFQHYWSNYDALSSANLNHWLFLAVVLNPDSHEVRHYSNGQLTGIAPIEFPSTALLGPAQIGNWDPQTLRNDAIRGFIGRIDELALIARPLSDQEIQAMYNAGGGQ